MLKAIFLKSASFTILSVYLILVLVSSFTSLMHRVSHDLQSALSGMEHIGNHHHSHLHTNSSHAHHAHPLIDFLKELSDQTEAPVNIPDLKIPPLSFHETQDDQAAIMPIVKSQNLHAPYLAMLLEGHRGLSTPPPQV